MGAMLGESFEPDPQFFVESWTIGIPAAMENFQQRRQIQSQPDSWQPTFRAFENAAFLNFVEDFETDGGSFRSARANVVADTYGFGRTMPFHEKDVPAPADHSSQARTPSSSELELVFPTSIESACELLGVAIDSTREQIKGAYRRMANQNHPDRLGQKNQKEQKRGAERMISINEAYRLVRTNLWGEAA